MAAGCCAVLELVLNKGCKNSPKGSWRSLGFLGHPLGTPWLAPEGFQGVHGRSLGVPGRPQGVLGTLLGIPGASLGLPRDPRGIARDPWGLSLGAVGAFPKLGLA